MGSSRSLYTHTRTGSHPSALVKALCWHGYGPGKTKLPDLLSPATKSSLSLSLQNIMAVIRGQKVQTTVEACRVVSSITDTGKGEKGRIWANAAASASHRSRHNTTTTNSSWAQRLANVQLRRNTLATSQKSAYREAQSVSVCLSPQTLKRSEYTLSSADTLDSIGSHREERKQRGLPDTCSSRRREPMAGSHAIFYYLFHLEF